MKYFNTPKSNIYPFLKEEVQQYFTIPPGYFGVPVALALDNDYFFSTYGHKPWLYFRNGYEDLPKYDWIPIFISEPPYIPVSWTKNITNEDLNKISKFIRINRSALLEMPITGRYKTIRSINDMSESYYYQVFEMASLREEYTGLYKQIWIDNIGTSPKHSKYRLKFKTDNSGKNSNSWSTITIDDLKIIGKELWPNDEMKKLKKFITINKDTLKQAIDEKWEVITIAENLIPIND